MSALLVALIASIALAVIPQKLTNEYANNAVGSAADGNQIAWQTLYLDGDWDKFILDYQQVVGVAGAEWLRVIMQVDLVLYIPDVYAYDNLKGIIWDLNGHSVTFSSGDLNFHNFQYVEITDTSAAGNGYIQHLHPDGNGNFGTVDFYDCDLVILSGGTIIGYFSPHTPTNGLMVGGKIIQDGNTSVGWQKFESVMVAPYIVNLDDYNYYIPDDSTGTCALSISADYVGAYNYAYGVAWDFPGNCVLTNITQKRPYYLYTRASNQTWFNGVWYTFNE